MHACHPWVPKLSGSCSTWSTAVKHTQSESEIGIGLESTTEANHVSNENGTVNSFFCTNGTG